MKNDIVTITFGKLLSKLFAETEPYAVKSKHSERTEISLAREAAFREERQNFELNSKTYNLYHLFGDETEIN